MSFIVKVKPNYASIIDDQDLDTVLKYTWRYDRGYAKAFIWNKETQKYKTLYMHRLIMNPGNLQVDHINGNRLDNTRKNLRLATNAENNRNKKKKQSKYSKYKGVTKVHGKYWAAQIVHNGTNMSLGYFKTELDAAKAYDNAAAKIHGEYAMLNFGRS